VSRIHRLPDHLINKIAAGEVVERPAAAMKELVENALDAAATTVTVDLRDGGASLMRVTDDGIGMTADEVELALARHATSKIARDEDLDAITTLGFRGEALPAICAVSRFTIQTRPREGGAGTRLVGEGGTVVQRLEVPGVAGTTVEIADLFYNTPARLKFLRTAAAELTATLRLLTALALAHPEVQLRATGNGRALLNAPRASGLRDRSGALLGYETAGRLLDVARASGSTRVTGLVSPPDLARGSRDWLVLVVNGRPVRDAVLLQTVLDAYRPLLPRDRYPVAVIAVDVPPADVDVNVHPTKAWARFRNARLLQELIFTAVQDALRQPTVMAVLGEGPPASASDVAARPAGEQPALFAETAAPYAATSTFGRVLGQVQDTFIVSTTESEVFFIDQHVAQERVLFERLKADAEAAPLPSQELLFADPLDVGPAGRVALERWLPTLARLGFALEVVDAQRVALRAVPVLLRGHDARRLLDRLIGELQPAKAEAVELDRALAFVACRAAIKANVPLAREEMERIVGDLGTAATPYFCPHGRPTVSRVSLTDIRKELKRTW
jgi:DNA mismatch repair protein MutL